ncbi:LysR family transcriptional regulator [Stakelama pacifica]|uniref:LysR family transcriptional regulator n=1 Tax=Stakelama pacifica TaxID=517720 RepID=A0A4R6FH01_9SPHN|nr:LysR family transcriptional regulator [Stakelama pacifica]TDN80651.1 LysR family transcriptional regulator [Stakelama pacifica]GGO97539.1 LysR family transcriptional regulator [Stakelama pacifica]
MRRLSDLTAFAEVARAGGFRDAAIRSAYSASTLSDAVRRLEEQLGVRLLNRTTRSVTLTEAGERLLERLEPALAEVGASLDAVNAFRDRPAGRLRLNVPGGVARLVLPHILPAFSAVYPDIRIEVTVDESFVDVLAAGCDAGIRYDERLEQDMIALPIGPARQRFALGAAPAYLAAKGVPKHPNDLLDHACLEGRFTSGRKLIWELERDGEVIRLEPKGPLLAQIGGGTELLVQAAIGGMGVVALFEDWLQPHFESGALSPVLTDWWPEFSGPFLYYPGRRNVPPPLRAFVDFIKSDSRARWPGPRR